MLSKSAFLALAAFGGSASAISGEADAVIERSRSSTATYAVYSRMFVSVPGETPFVDWSAEFHRGTKHRLDAAKHRMVADCATRNGTYFNVVTGEKQSGAWVAAAACGVNANKELLAKEHLGTRQTPHGAVDRIRLTDRDDVRTYEILSSGAILSAVYAEPFPSKVVRVRQEPIAVQATLPSLDIFSEESLEASVVPARYRSR